MYWFLFYNNTLLLKQNGDGWKIPFFTDCPPILEPSAILQPLPTLEGENCVAARLDTSLVRGGFQMIELRESYELLPREHYILAGKAQELLYWDETTRFCGVCGGAMKRDTEISKRCEHCGKEVWPALTPAVIVAVGRGEEILLVQGRNFRADYMGLVAGFVETGETLEEAVAREVLEETNLCVSNIRYYASQPWPYPNALMIGFMADYESGELCLQHSELNKGGWFHYTELPRIPSPVSLARHLIDAWQEKIVAREE